MVTVVSNDDILDDDGNEIEALGVAVCEQVVGPGPWIQTSFNNNFRKQYAGVGFTYDPVADVFIRPSPYPSWALDNNYDWQAPIPMPDDGGFYEWNEETQTWDRLLSFKPIEE
jgi:hypothetical protein